MLDYTHWLATSALIDEACYLTGNTILTGEGWQFYLTAGDMSLRQGRER